MDFQGFSIRGGGDYDFRGHFTEAAAWAALREYQGREGPLALGEAIMLGGPGCEGVLYAVYALNWWRVPNSKVLEAFPGVAQVYADMAELVRYRGC